jgi:hypothetical protein
MPPEPAGDAATDPAGDAATDAADLSDDPGADDQGGVDSQSLPPKSVEGDGAQQDPDASPIKGDPPPDDTVVDDSADDSGADAATDDSGADGSADDSQIMTMQGAGDGVDNTAQPLSSDKPHKGKDKKQKKQKKAKKAKGKPKHQGHGGKKHKR